MVKFMKKILSYYLMVVITIIISSGFSLNTFIDVHEINHSTVKQNDEDCNIEDVQDFRHVMNTLEEKPEPKDGYETFYKYLDENMQYPQEAKEKGIEGRVFVSFVIDSDGNIQCSEIMKSFDESCGKEAIRLMNNAPAWNSGVIDGKKVNIRMVLPIQFKLN